MKRLLPKPILTLCMLLLTTVFSTHLMAQETIVEFRTNKGRFSVMLYDDTPIHRDNFLKIVREGGFNEVLFHRVIANFMVQAGGDLRTTDEAAKEYFHNKYDHTLQAEILYPKYYHKVGALAAARVVDETNPDKRSDGIQFFIVTGQFFLERELDQMATEEKPMLTEIKQVYMTQGGAPHLDGDYTVFGEVVKGMEVIKKIESAATDTNDRPLKDLYIQSARILQQ